MPRLVSNPPELSTRRIRRLSPEWVQLTARSTRSQQILLTTQISLWDKRDLACCALNLET